MTDQLAALLREADAAWIAHRDADLSVAPPESSYDHAARFLTASGVHVGDEGLRETLRTDLRAAIVALRQPTLGLAGGVSRGEVIDAIDRVFAALAPKEAQS